MYRFLLRPRWLVLIALVVLVVVPACVKLGQWQYDRYEDRGDRNALIRANVAAPAAPVQQTAPAGTRVPATDEWRTVTATGEYDIARQLLVRNRSSQGRAGFLVVTPLRLGDGSGVLVNRGWIPAGATAATALEPPAPPSGEVTVTGRIRPPEPSGRRLSGLPPGHVVRIDETSIASAAPYPMPVGYLDLGEERPPAAETPVLPEEPRPGWGPHLAYAVQWWLFGVIAVVGLAFLARREAHDLVPAPLRGA